MQPHEDMDEYQLQQPGSSWSAPTVDHAHNHYTEEIPPLIR